LVCLLVALVASALGAAPAGAAAPKLARLYVNGNQIMRRGVPFHFYGVNRDSLEWGLYNWGGCGGDGHFTDADFDVIAAWHVTAVRLPLSEAGWLGRRCDPAGYAQAVDAAVAKANARGMYAILDLHWSDVGGQAPCDAGCRSGQQPMPDSGSRTFWRQVARHYRRNPGVVFDLYNEPHGVSWGCWRSGGCNVHSSTVDPATGMPVDYKATGMQQLLQTVRAAKAHNLVLVPGLDWAFDLWGVGRGYALSGSNVAYDTHVYIKQHSDPADWQTHFGYLTASYPVTATEFGSIDCSTTVTAPLLDYFAAPGGNPNRRMSWTVWSWNTPGSCSQPSLIADWQGMPLAGQGALIHDRLAALGP
jgi:endoglucanase